jgi:hypothetical protein
LTAGEISSLNRFSVNCIRDFEWYVPMIREYIEVKNGLAMTNTNTVNGAGPALMYCD